MSELSVSGPETPHLSDYGLLPGPSFGCTTARSGRGYLSSGLRARRWSLSQCGGCGGPREGERRREAATVAVVVKAIAKCCYCRYCYATATATGVAVAAADADADATGFPSRVLPLPRPPSPLSPPPPPSPPSAAFLRASAGAASSPLLPEMPLPIQKGAQSGTASAATIAIAPAIVSSNTVVLAGRVSPLYLPSPPQPSLSLLVSLSCLQSLPHVPPPTLSVCPSLPLGARERALRGHLS